MKFWVGKTFAELTGLTIIYSVSERVQSIIDLLIAGFLIVVLNTIFVIVWSLIKMQLRLWNNRFKNKMLIKNKEDKEAQKIIKQTHKEIERNIKENDKKYKKGP